MIKLFNEFSPINSKQWKQKIQHDLKGADYNDTLIWKTKEEINVKPFYHEDEFEDILACTVLRLAAEGGQEAFRATKSGDSPLDSAAGPA